MITVALYYVLTLTQKAPKVWHDCPVDGVLLSADDVARARYDRVEELVYDRVFASIPKILDSGAYRSVSKGVELDIEQVIDEQWQDLFSCQLIVPVDYPVKVGMSARQASDCIQRSHETACRWFSEFGERAVYVLHGHTVPALRQSLSLMRSLEDEVGTIGHVALGGVAQLRRRPRHIFSLVRFALSQLADRQLHVFGVGGSLAVVLAVLGVGSVDSSSPNVSASFGRVRDPKTYSSRRIAGAGQRDSRVVKEITLDDLFSACGCPVCAVMDEGIKEPTIAGHKKRIVHNYWLLRKMMDRREVNKAYLPLIREALERSTQSVLEFPSIGCV